MKAKAGLLMLLIALVSFTGFGFTTSDLDQNSTAEIVQIDLDHSVNVVTPEIDWEQFKKDVEKASDAAVIETNIKLESRFDALFSEADKAFMEYYKSELEQLAVPPDLKFIMLPVALPNDLNKDVGWCNCKG